MRLIIGLMSGTSVDAIDAALVGITGTRGQYRAQVLHHHEHAWPPALRRRLLAVMAPATTSTAEICELNILVAAEFARAVNELVKKARVPHANVTALASHGQTICHLPPKALLHKNRKPKIENRKFPISSTLQLGDLSTLATLSGIKTVGNFRPADMAVGGQGAPLVPWADAMLLTDRRKTRCIQNIGGIANVTFLPATDHRPLTTRHCVLAFDTGPGNMLLDALVSLITQERLHFDENGRLAAAGQLDPILFRSLQNHRYFKRKPPKSTGREDFGLPFARTLTTHHRPLTTLLHTATRLTAWSIADAYRRFLPRMPDEVILCGGGADNPTLVRMLREELGPAIALRRIDDFGIPNKAKEAASFALLAAATLDGVPGNLPSVTGARRPVVLGVVATPQ